jgi:hypothetical protein
MSPRQLRNSLLKAKILLVFMYTLQLCYNWHFFLRATHSIFRGPLVFRGPAYFYRQFHSWATHLWTNPIICPATQDSPVRFITLSSCSAELISTAYQPWNSVFLSQQNSHSRFISHKTACQTGPIYYLPIYYLCS